MRESIKPPDFYNQNGFSEKILGLKDGSFNEVLKKMSPEKQAKIERSIALALQMWSDLVDAKAMKKVRDNVEDEIDFEKRYEELWHQRIRLWAKDTVLTEFGEMSQEEAEPEKDKIPGSEDLSEGNYYLRLIKDAIKTRLRNSIITNQQVRRSSSIIPPQKR